MLSVSQFLEVEATFSDCQWNSFIPVFTFFGFPSDKESTLEEKFFIIFKISLWLVSISLILLQTDLSTFSEISEKSLSDILCSFSVLAPVASGYSTELVGESLLVSLFSVLSGLFRFQILKGPIFYSGVYRLNEKLENPKILLIEIESRITKVFQGYYQFT